MGKNKRSLLGAETDLRLRCRIGRIHLYRHTGVGRPEYQLRGGRVGCDTGRGQPICADEFPGLIGSWNAINPVTGAAHEVITPRPGCSMTRPNGSGEGLNALRKSLNQTTTAVQLADPPITREVCNIVQRTRIVNTGGGFDPTVAALLVGTSSQTVLG